MDEDNKLPLKRVELSLTKFNEVAIPHHLDLLRQHKTNIIKLEAEGDSARARSEQTHARRVTSQLRALLQEMDGLRAQVRGDERARFDALTQRSRDDTLKAIQDYLGSAPLPLARAAAAREAAASAASTDSVGVVAHLPLDEPGLIQLHVDDQLAAREEVLRGWSELHAELHALHAVWQRAHAAAHAQAEHAQLGERGVQRAQDHVLAARGHLASAERLRGVASASCAAAGALLGGPLGLLAGAKLGALGAAAGALLGYLGARALRPAPPPPPPPPPPHKDR